MTGYRVGVIGLGVISRFHLAALARVPELQLAALCDPDPARCARVRPSAGPVAWYRDHRRLLREAAVDAVVVTVPNDLHGEVCRDALAAGVPVCVEKPLAVDAPQARELAELAAVGKTCLFTAFHRRYNSEVAALLGRLGPRPSVASMTVRYHERIEDHAGPDGWYLDPRRCGGGCLADNGPNAFDLVRLVLGEVRVAGCTVRRDARGVDRQAVVALEAAGGAEARVDLDWSYPGERKDIVVRLADGTVDGADLLAGRPGFKESLWHEYEGVLRDFAAALRGGGGTGGDGLAAAELVAECYEQERKAAVR